MESNITTMSEALKEYMKYYYMTQNFVHPTLGVTLTVICVIGMLANILNVIALSMIIKKSKLPVYRCFLGLAIADFMVVFFTSVKNGSQYLIKSKMVIDITDIEQATSNHPFNYIYYLMPHFTNVAFAASNWCVVAMSSLRCIAVFTPLWYQRHCTIKVVNTILVLVYLMSIIINIPSFITTRYDPQTKLFYDKTMERFNPKVVSLFVIQVCPIVITTVLVGLLICKLCRRPAIERSASNAEYRNRDKLQTSITLVCISAFFVFTITPSVAFLFYRYFSEFIMDGEKQYHLYKVHAVVELFLVLNYTANFCFYVLLNARLRRKLKHILHCPKGSGRDRSHSFACITQQSSLSDRITASEMGGDHNSSIGWSPASILNGNKHRRSIDHNGKRKTRRSASATSTGTQGSTVSFKLKSSYCKPAFANQTINKPAERVTLFNIEENGERDCLISKPEHQSPSIDLENSSDTASKKSLALFGEDNSNINKNLCRDEDVKEMVDKISEVLADTTMILPASVSMQSNGAMYNADADAPIATLDTMHDLESQCENKSLL